MAEKDYWSDLTDKCKTSKRDRFNYIMNEIKGNSSSDDENNNSSNTGNVNVTVTDTTGKAVSNVLVNIHNDDDESISLNGTTGSAGGCIIRNVPYGEYTISTEADGYEMGVEGITIDSDDIYIDISIEKEVDDDF